MKYYPIGLNIFDKKVLVVGGGNVASRKIERLIEKGAEITVISPEIIGDIDTIAKKSKIKWVKRIYEIGDEEGFFAVFCAISPTDENTKTEEELYKRCIQKNILINVADKPDLCTFTLPALVSRGEFDIAIFTGGFSPLFARKIREGLEKIYGEEYTVFVKILGLVRKEVKKKNLPQKKNQEIFDKLLSSELFELVKEKKYNDISLFLSNFLEEVR
ncbi:MAG: bifunctional precorrin-2 dehydrogenase/sirohydrochlorin ferrochelatase [Candidatus Acididesulfobacter diazotrophicus]|jgi:precorrin-2 dehydrogenase/sirohydrochlorin ferrochelatase|uniref:precorrin-2 dehydrogenase n=1 Tax=Candidatus Acididesulfobacter diazotrophicus TaxID=2597226 RepID=A0A519BPY5_9DELT|nr:MAG: bifunctional precorrin-2 dehydrogenase/sirohydrochlorin ferrochelatase [Candidatus Acididesulfobacter diazotrophicus]